jgi:hypothetical protein
MLSKMAVQLNYHPDVPQDAKKGAVKLVQSFVRSLDGWVSTYDASKDRPIVQKADWAQVWVEEVAASFKPKVEVKEEEEEIEGESSEGSPQVELGGLFSE